MKKLTILLFIVLMFSCSSSKYENSLNQLNLKGSVKSLKRINYTDEAMMFGELRPVNLLWGEILNFDKNGNMTQSYFVEFIDGDWIIGGEEIGNQEIGNWDSNLNFFNVQNLQEAMVVKFKTNKNGHISRKDTFLPNGNLRHIEKYEYDSKSRLISIKSYLEDGKLFNNQIHNYANSNGCSILKTEEDATGYSSKKIRCVKYKNGVKIVEDENGNILEEYNEKGDLAKKTNISYSNPEENYFYVDFDKQGNWLKRYYTAKYEESTYKQFEIRIIEYY